MAARFRSTGPLRAAAEALVDHAFRVPVRANDHVAEAGEPVFVVLADVHRLELPVEPGSNAPCVDILRETTSSGFRQAT